MHTLRDPNRQLTFVFLWIEARMTRLLPLIFSIAGVTCAGIAMVAALVLGHDTVQLLLAWIAGGAIVGLGASWVIARKLIDA